MHQAPVTRQISFQKHIDGCTRFLGTTRCNSNLLLLLHGIGSTRAGRYARLICTDWEADFFL
jgi:hypothetical protein